MVQNISGIAVLWHYKAWPTDKMTVAKMSLYFAKQVDILTESDFNKEH